MHTGNADFVVIFCGAKRCPSMMCQEKDSPNYVVPIKTCTKWCSAINDTKRFTKLCSANKKHALNYVVPLMTHINTHYVIQFRNTNNHVKILFLKNEKSSHRFGVLIDTHMSLFTIYPYSSGYSSIQHSSMYNLLHMTFLPMPVQLVIMFKLKVARITLIS